MKTKQLANFFFEAGTMRKLARSHRQVLLTDDLSDNIASHSYRVTLIAYFLAQMEHADTEKVLTMAIFHDMAETRAGDQNWVNKKYVKVFDDEIMQDQLGGLTKGDKLLKIMQEYEKRESLEAKIAKDADLLDQILLLKEYVNNGNKEASVWLDDKVAQKRLHTDSAKKLSEEIYSADVHDWWWFLWTDKRR